MRSAVAPKFLVLLTAFGLVATGCADGDGEAQATTVPATLITQGPDGLTSTIIPMLVELSPDGGHGPSRLLGHVAKANRDVTKAAGQESLAVFTGPQGYISPSWYPSKAEHGEVVPTWDYVTVQVAGALTVHHDPAWLLDLVTRLTDRHEADKAAPWQVSDAPEAYITAALAGIVAAGLVADPGTND